MWSTLDKQLSVTIHSEGYHWYLKQLRRGMQDLNLNENRFDKRLSSANDVFQECASKVQYARTVNFFFDLLQHKHILSRDQREHQTRALSQNQSYNDRLGDYLYKFLPRSCPILSVKRQNLICLWYEMSFVWTNVISPNKLFQDLNLDFRSNSTDMSHAAWLMLIGNATQKLMTSWRRLKLRY